MARMIGRSPTVVGSGGRLLCEVQVCGLIGPPTRTHGHDEELGSGSLWEWTSHAQSVSNIDPDPISRAQVDDFGAGLWCMTRMNGRSATVLGSGAQLWCAVRVCGLIGVPTRMQDPGSRIPDPRSRIPDPRSQIPDPRSQIHELQCFFYRFWQKKQRKTFVSGSFGRFRERFGDDFGATVRVKTEW